MIKNKIYNKSCEKLEEIKDGEINLVVSSPPYYNLREYSTWESYASYRSFITNVLNECFRVLSPGGWLCWNIQECIPFPPSVKENRKHKERYCEPLLAHSICDLEDIGFVYEKTIAWYKGVGTAKQRLLSSYPYPSLILLTSLMEYIILVRKPSETKRIIDPEIKNKSKLTKKEWSDWSLDMWEIPPVHASHKNHPAPFPLEIPNRLIRMFSFYDDLVLDPFMGGGTTAIAALQSGRFFVGYEIHQKFIDATKNRISLENNLFGDLNDRE